MVAVPAAAAAVVVADPGENLWVPCLLVLLYAGMALLACQISFSAVVEPNYLSDKTAEQFKNYPILLLKRSFFLEICT